MGQGDEHNDGWRAVSEQHGVHQTVELTLPCTWFQLTSDHQFYQSSAHSSQLYYTGSPEALIDPAVRLGLAHQVAQAFLRMKEARFTELEIRTSTVTFADKRRFYIGLTANATIDVIQSEQRR